MSNLGVDVHLSNVTLIQLEVNLCCKTVLNPLFDLQRYGELKWRYDNIYIGSYKRIFIKNQVYCTESGWTELLWLPFTQCAA